MKEISFKLAIGEVADDAPNYANITFETGAEYANKLWGELNGKYGQDFNKKPVIVIPSDSTEGADKIKETLADLSNVVPEAMESQKEQIKEAQDQFIKHTTERIGEEVIISRSEIIEEIDPFIEQLAPLFNAHAKLSISAKGNKTIQHQLDGHTVVHGLFSGSEVNVDLRVEQNFIEEVLAAMVTFGAVPSSEEIMPLSMASKFFKRYHFEVAADSVDTLPENFQKLFDSKMLRGPLQKFLYKNSAEFLPLLEHNEFAKEITGPIKIYYVIKDEVAVTIEIFQAEFFANLNQLVTDLKAEFEANNE